MADFIPFPKIPRYKGAGIIITEKIDGTNAQVYITDNGQLHVGSRTRWISPEHDNFGFARWVRDNEESVRKLGVGHHYGEWWGPGIQRGYSGKEKVFSLFNAHRHDNVTETTGNDRIRTVPVLYKGESSDAQIDACIANLDVCGSVVSPGFMRPEGIVIYHVASRQSFKWTFGGDHK